MSLLNRLNRKINKLGRDYDIKTLSKNVDLSGESIGSTISTLRLFVYDERNDEKQTEFGAKPIELIEFLAKAEDLLTLGDRVLYNGREFTVSKISPYLDGKQTIAKECKAERVI